MGEFGFGKEMRLSGRDAVSRLFADGQGGFVYPYRYVFTAKPDESGVAVLVTVPKKNHKRANKRNLLKRRTREAFRTRNGALKLAAQEKNITVHIALIYAVKEIVEYKTVADAVGKILAQVGQRL